MDRYLPRTDVFSMPSLKLVESYKEIKVSNDSTSDDDLDIAYSHTVLLSESRAQAKKPSSSAVISIVSGSLPEMIS
jgi:hypothetical protein